MTEELTITLHGYSAATTHVERETWEKWSRKEKRDWCASQLRKHGSITDVASVTVNGGEEELEW